jgi:hypothetical protein
MTFVPFGRAGAGAAGGVINGYTKHGLAQAIGRDAGRGLSPAAILNAVKAPASKTLQADGSTIYRGPNAVVVLNQNGRVITTWATNSSGLRGAP